MFCDPAQRAACTRRLTRLPAFDMAAAVGIFGWDRLAIYSELETRTWLSMAGSSVATISRATRNGTGSLRICGRLSPQETWPVRRLIAGHSEESIARDEGLSVGVVRAEDAALYAKLGVRSREELVAMAEGEP